MVDETENGEERRRVLPAERRLVWVVRDRDERAERAERSKWLSEIAMAKRLWATIAWLAAALGVAVAAAVVASERTYRDEERSAFAILCCMVWEVCVLAVYKWALWVLGNRKK